MDTPIESTGNGRQAFQDVTNIHRPPPPPPPPDNDLIAPGEKPAKSTTSQAKSSAGTKRKSSDAVTSDSESEQHLENIDLDGMYLDKSCQQVRGLIRRFLDSGAMTKGAFCEDIGVSSRVLNNFLSKNGSMKGVESDAYQSAWAFFKKREIAGVKMPASKKAKTAKGSTPAASAHAAVDISGVHLLGEEEDDVPVYDTCDEVRRKIDAHLKATAVSQAQFCRDIGAQLRSGTKVSGTQLSSFRGKKGPNAGASSAAFYGAYVYLEKVRVKTGKPKSKHRTDMESIWEKEGGLPRRDNSRGFWCGPDERPFEDKYGRLRFEKI